MNSGLRIEDIGLGFIVEGAWSVQILTVTSTRAHFGFVVYGVRFQVCGFRFQGSGFEFRISGSGF